MTLSNHADRSAKSIFLEAVEKYSPDQWPEVLDQKCGANQELRQQVEILLGAHRADDSLFDRTQTSASPNRTEDVGATIGPYKLLQRLGEGGMGTVFLAERHQPVNQRVALKIIRQGMDTKQFVARFEAERQALAMMDHPNIAKVLDAGCTDNGRPYFVMELVKGIPISEFCDENRLTTRQRLELFVQVCRAVQHAHQKGIIHRDLKPSNVMVALYDDKPVPKVIDFGVAKATNQQLTDKTLFTEVGSILGTWEYMSPEQAVLNQLDVDTRSDVYSLGVLLYELLTGETPLDRKRLRQAQVLETLRMIREDEPPKPSTRVSSLGERATALAAYRGTDPQTLAAEIRGDLDWVVMKALAKERARRYDSASRLAEDVQHYLNQELVEARPPSAVYRLRKFCQRNKAAVLGTSSVVLALAIGIAWVAERNYRLQRTLSELRETHGKLVVSSLNEAMLTALGGDTIRAEQRLHELESTEVERGDLRLLQGLIALGRSEYGQAIALAEQSFQEPSTLQGKDKIGATALKFAASYWTGRFEVTQSDQLKLQSLPRGEDIDELLRAYALTCVRPDITLRVLENVPHLERSPLGLFVRGQGRLQQAVDAGDQDLLERALLDLEWADFLLRDSNTTAGWRALGLTIAIEKADADGRDQVAKRLGEIAVGLTKRLRTGEEWIRMGLFTALGEDKSALETVRSIQVNADTNGNMDYLVTFYLMRYDYPEAFRCYTEMTSGKDTTTKYARIAKAHLIRGEANGAREVRELVMDLVYEPVTFIQRAAINVLCTACSPDEIRKYAKLALAARPSSEGLDDLLHEEDCLEFFAGDRSAEELIAIAGSHRYALATFHYTIAMKCLAERDRAGALENFEKAVATQTFGSDDFELARAYLARMQKDSEWPHWLKEPAESQ